jgi:hypothetical protein
VSTDHLLRSLEQNAQAISSLRQQPPLFAALATLEDANPDPFNALRDGLRHFVERYTDAGEFILQPEESTRGGTLDEKAIYTDQGVEATHGRNVLRSFTALAHRMESLLMDFPESLLSRLGLYSPTGTIRGDWIRVLFHLAWHFPEHFARGVVCRSRILVADPGEYHAPEDWLQLYGCNPANDRFSGLIYSHFPRQLDLVTATEWAIDLFLSALRSEGSPELTDAIRIQFEDLHRAFTEVGQQIADLGNSGPIGELEAKVLRLSSSFRSRPAAEWAEVQASGAHQDVYFVSRRGEVKECCILRGAWVAPFRQLADRAGSLLPVWPAEPTPALLEDAYWWRMRKNRYHELAAQTFYYCTEDGSAPHGREVPASIVASQYWGTTRPSPGSHPLVTDHRGNVERWLGFLFHILKEFQPDSVSIRTLPEGQFPPCGDWNAVLTLCDMNLFQASARALELTSWLLPPLSRAAGGTPYPEAQEDPVPDANSSGQPVAKPAYGESPDNCEVKAERDGTANSIMPELANLRATAQQEYASTAKSFWLVAGLQTGNGLRVNRCKWDDPAAGTIRDGVMWLPWGCPRPLESVNLKGGARYKLVSLSLADEAELERFTAFARQAGAALVAEPPAWAKAITASDPVTTWVALLFFSPCTAGYVSQRDGGGLLITSPWAASLAMLRAWADPGPELTPAPPVAPSEAATESKASMQSGMPWQEAAERMKRLRAQGEPWTSQQKMAEQFGCSSFTINKAIKKTPELQTWANQQATTAPRAQSLNDVVTDHTAQSAELNPEDDAAIREFIEGADPEVKAWFLALPLEKQLEVVNDPDKYQQILGRKP